MRGLPGSRRKHGRPRRITLDRRVPYPSRCWRPRGGRSSAGAGSRTPTASAQLAATCEELDGEFKIHHEPAARSIPSRIPSKNRDATEESSDGMRPPSV